MEILDVLFLFISFLMIISADWACGYFGLSCFEQIVFHLKVPLDGTNKEFIYDFFRLCFLKALLLAIAAFFILHFFNIAGNLILILIFIISLIISGQRIKIWGYIFNLFRKSDIYEKYYADPKRVEIIPPLKKMNLITIYVESLENTFMAKKDGGDYESDLIAPLSKIRKENISFSHNDKMGGAKIVSGTGWTTGGIIAQTAGIPLLIPLGHKRFKDESDFLKGTTTLYDILKKDGYYNEFIIGSNAYFGGRKFYFDKHNIDLIFDHPYAIKNHYLKDDYHIFWGFEDEKLFTFAKEEIIKAAKRNEPFNISILTVDTHHPKGYKGKDYQEIYPERLSNIIALEAIKVAEFVEWLKKQPFYEDSVILITGDHTSMAQTYISKTYDKDYDRTIFNTYINARRKPVTTKDRLFTSFDYFPTTLSALGYEIKGHKLGLGTDLFSGQKTLAETLGLEVLDKELRKQSAYFKKHLL